MYNISILGDNAQEIADVFGEKYSITDDLTQTNVIIAGLNEFDISEAASGATCISIPSHEEDQPDSSGMAPEKQLCNSGMTLTDADFNSKLIFAAAGVPAKFCSDRGIVVFGGCSDSSHNDTVNMGKNVDDYSHYDQQIQNIRDFIENGNISESKNFPDVSLGPFGDDVSRISILMHGIDDPILLAAMMFSGMNIKAIAGGLNGEYGYALVASREPVTRVPHVDGVLKVRVLQDI